MQSIVQEPARYAVGAESFEGALFRPSSPDGSGLLVVHDFLGISENQLAPARRFAARGATVLVVDLYGAGKRPADLAEADAMARAVRADVPRLRAVMTAAFEALAAAPRVARERIGALGMSLGAVGVTELARTTAPLAAIATLWGVLENTRPEDARPIRARTLVAQGDRDPLAPAEALERFVAELRAGGVEPRVAVYSGVAHAFTVPGVGTDVATGFAYDEAAANNAWAEIDAFFAEL